MLKHASIEMVVHCEIDDVVMGKSIYFFSIAYLIFKMSRRL